MKAVIAESYERIHRNNLIGMGVIPLQFPQGENADSLGLAGTETFSISGITEAQRGAHAADRPRRGDGRGRRHQGVRRGGPHRHAW